MTPDELALLTAAQDRIVAIELNTGERLFAEIVILVEQPPTPDVYVLRVNREPDGAFVPATASGESILLADIRRVAPLPGMEYPGWAAGFEPSIPQA